ncbi:ABC transporter substrate-binding protein [Breznakiella homolactica]|uniref:ABC transporter substrate-binding protein n=1 Tax=Breznakiella homolactica TaxID=2798577 RepID=A0A7T7XMG0_9SPIR|nr:ABC transporter substrate-binding protein [Breznakiella homolactica]QQO09069.1 ABC transporter substrate-binding protein [Breznakiella homolactica]
MNKATLKRSLFAALILTVFCAAPLLAGGGQDKATGAGGPVEVSFWSLFTGGDGEFFDAMVAEFNRTHPDIVMKTDTVKFDDYYTKLTTALAARNAPDVVVVHQSNLLNYVPKGSLYSLDDLLTQVNAPLDDFFAAPLEACRFDGKLYALPLDVHALIMYYNTELFRQAGVSKVPVTYDEVIQAAQAVRDRTGAMGLAVDNTTATYKAYTLTRLFMSLLKQQGVDILSADNTKANFNNAAGEKALQGLIDTVQRYKVTPAQLDYDGAMAEFRLGKAGMHFNGVWATGAFEKQDGLTFAAVPLPAMMGQPAAWSGSHTLAVPVQKTMDQKKLEAAVTFILWMTEHGELWAKAGHIPTRKSVSEKPEFKALPYRSGYADAAASAIAPPRTGAWDEIYNGLSDSLEYAVATNQNVKTALAEMERKVNNIIASY